MRGPWGATSLALVFATGCAAQASEEWTTHGVDAIPRVARVELESVVIRRGAVFAGDLVVADRPEGVALRSGAISVGYGFRDVVASRVVDLGVNLLARHAIGKPTMLASRSLEGGVGPRVEVTVAEAKDPTHETFTILDVHPEVVFSVDGLGWLGPKQFFDLTGGVGLRVSIDSAARAPLTRFLRSLF